MTAHAAILGHQNTL